MSFAVLHSDTEGSEICVNMRLSLAPLTLSGLCHGLYHKVFELIYGITLRHWGALKYEAFSSTADAKWTLSRPLFRCVCVVLLQSDAGTSHCHCSTLYYYCRYTITAVFSSSTFIKVTGLCLHRISLPLTHSCSLQPLRPSLLAPVQL